MCGIVGAVAERNVSAILLEGLKRLEYRGYDSAGVAVINAQQELKRCRAQGKVAEVERKLAAAPLLGCVGVAHTRWATHGKPSENNAHPHLSSDELALVHNGIIENHEPLRKQLQAAGYVFTSETDTEVVAHLVHQIYQQTQDLTEAVRQTILQLDGAYALAVIHQQHPHELVCARKGSPLVIGVGIGETFCASDPLALLQVTDRFIYLEEGDLATLTLNEQRIVNQQGETVVRPTLQWEHGNQATEKGEYRHFMLKEIYEQPSVIAATLEGRLSDSRVLPQALGAEAMELLPKVKQVQIIACGTSYHAGMVARYWIERLAGLPCQVEVASEYRYRDVVVAENCLFVTISQSGETADTLAALRFAKNAGYLGSLAVCNAPGSSLVRESDLSLMTQAGPEIGVASTKAFTTQLTALMLLTLSLRRAHSADPQAADPVETELVQALRFLPRIAKATLQLDTQIELMAQDFAEKNHALFLGRGSHYPVAMEGALKLKEISYIHAEAYPAGELKHGPLALVDDDMPVIAVAPKDDLVEKLKSNLQEVRARGGKLYVFAEPSSFLASKKLLASKNLLESEDGMKVLHLPEVHDVLAPIIYTLPLQLLAYYVAVLKGTDVDQPRNLAKSVTVE